MAGGEGELSPGRRTFLSVLIALTATSGALVTWQGSRVGAAADASDGQSIAAALNEAATEMSIASDVFLSETNSRHLQEHLASARRIYQDVMTHREVPDRWLDDWQREIIRAQVRHLQVNLDFLRFQDGRPVFDRERYRQAVRAQAAGEKPIEAATFCREAEDKRREAVFLIGLNLLFTSAIFLFTVALRMGPGGKTAWTAAGLAVYICAAGLALWKMVF